MGRREQIRGRLEAATPRRWAAEHSGHLGESGAWSVYPVADMWADEREAENADLIAHAPADLRDLLAVADAAADMASYVPDSLPKGAGPRCGACRSSVEFCDEQRAAVGRRCRGGDVRDALDRLDNEGDR